MIPASDGNAPRPRLLLEVAFETERVISFREHLGIHRAMRLMASGAAFAHSLVLKDKGSVLRGVAFGAGVMLGSQRRAASFDGRSLVRIMAISARHLACEHRMAVGKIESRSHFQMTLKAGLRRLIWIDDRVARAAGFVVEAAGTVARLAAHVRGVRSPRDQLRVCRGVKTFGDVFVALRATFRADKLGSGNLRRGHDDPRDTDTGNEDGRHEHAAEGHQHLCARDAEEAGSLRWWSKVIFRFHRSWLMKMCAMLGPAVRIRRVKERVESHSKFASQLNRSARLGNS
jgi:hypothetical protein